LNTDFILSARLIFARIAQYWLRISILEKKIVVIKIKLFMIQAIRGTKDLLPEVIRQWQFIENVFRTVSDKYGYNELRTPIFEKTEVFSRGIGEGTDVVNKEMYTFKDKSDNSITLRPEMTAALVRAVLQDSLHTKQSTNRLWYFGPFFRYERPQKGRQRQFHQFGAECISPLYPESDVEVIMLADDVVKTAGIKDYKLLLNTLGTVETRKRYKTALTEYLHSIKDTLSQDSQNRLDHNPLRVLDSKAPEDKEAVKNAPVILDYLDAESAEHFEKVKELLAVTDINVEISPMLVRGLDYYCHTVFEFQSSALGAQDAFGGGGRYNGLFQLLGSKKEVPAVGFAMGVERLLLILEASDEFKLESDAPDIFVAATDVDYIKQAQITANKLRAKGLKVIVDLHRRSIKAQMREANKINSRFSIVIGANEIETNKINIKNMAKSEQSEYPLDTIENFDFK
jgi:histidyl-tRNA synthetase